MPMKLHFYGRQIYTKIYLFMKKGVVMAEGT